MPEVRMRICWPDGEEDHCYSPSSLIKEYFEEGKNYSLEDFMVKARLALNAASDRVKKLYGYPCSAAKGQLQALELKALTYKNIKEPIVQTIVFED